MFKVAIIGNAGGGKSLLARQLGVLWGLPVHSIDDVQWDAGWHPAEQLQVAAAHNAWLRAGRWIIDGWGSWDLIAQRFAAAERIILIDFPLRDHYRWAARRQREVRAGRRTDWPPAGCDAASITPVLLRTMQYVHTTMRPRLLAMLQEPALLDRVVHIRSPEQLDSWRRGLGVSTSPHA